LSDPPERYDGPGPNADNFDPKRHLWDGRNWWTSDLLWWWDGARWQSRDTPSPPPPTAEGKKPRPPGYRRDFWLGFFGTIAVNVILLIALTNIASANYAPVGSIVNLVPWVVNIGALVVFAIVRPRVAIGMLLAYGIALGVALVAGLFLLVLCFGGGSGVP
jgi:hypothetical protein